GVDPRFLIGVVHAPSFVEHAISGTTGVQHPRTSWHHIGGFELPDFSPNERRNIADLIWRVDGAIKANEAAISAGIDLKRAAMSALFTRGLRGDPQKETEIGPVPQSWRLTPVDELCEEVTVGVVVRPASHYVAHGVPAFRSLNVRED